MYAKLAYNADSGNTNEQVLEDIKDLLLGETVLANIVGNIDVATSVIDTSFTTVAYTLYDTVGTNAFIFQIPYHDDAAQFFYVELKAAVTNEIHQQLYGAWDTGSNTGSNGAHYATGTGNGNEIVLCTGNLLFGTYDCGRLGWR